MRYIRPILDFIIYSNLFIAWAAVAFTFEAQVLLAQNISWHPYLFIIFFATFFDYNLHRLYTIVFYKEALAHEKHEWLRHNLLTFYILLTLATVGFFIALIFAKTKVILTLAPIAALTIFYSVPYFYRKGKAYRLRDVPYLKLLLISFNWTAITLLLPIAQAGHDIGIGRLIPLAIERFLFMCAICLPFDIRDMEADRQSNLMTIPLRLGEDKSWALSYWLMGTSAVFSLIYHLIYGEPAYALALCLSGLISLWLLKSDRMKQSHLYHYGVVDGLLILQSLLVVLAHHFYY